MSELENLVHEARKRVWGRALRAGTSRIAIQCQQRHRVNRLPRQLRPEWVVTPCLRGDPPHPAPASRRLQWLTAGSRRLVAGSNLLFQKFSICARPALILRGCLGTHFRNSLKIGRLDKINPLF
ncbi:MAG: hypothetical protein [Olavius algarvensis Gamma 1 endosymbiont]|nr:MAG: hypothetical protein [Olavius algarvensis Gamma 1 endosymbiont]